MKGNMEQTMTANSRPTRCKMIAAKVCRILPPPINYLTIKTVADIIRPCNIGRYPTALSVPCGSALFVHCTVIKLENKTFIKQNF